MTKPSQTMLRTVMAANATNEGYLKLREMGYTMSRQVCRDMRNQLRSEGEVKYQRSKWTAERIVEVRKMVAERKSSSHIAFEFDTTPKRVYDLCHRLGIPLTKGAPIKSLPNREKLDAVYQANSIARTAEVFGVSVKTASRWITTHGLKRDEPIEPIRRTVAASPPRAPMRNACYRPADLPPPETGPAADAARYLRYVGYANVYRRSDKEWWVGRGPMAEADMIARAEEVRARKERLRA